MELKEFKKLLFESAKNAGFTDCEIYYSNSESLSISVYEEEVEKYKLNKSFGLSFRGLLNGKMGYSFTEIIDKDAIDMLIKNAKEAALCIENEDKQFIYKGDKEYSKVSTYSKELENVNADELIKIALDMEKETKSYSDKVINIPYCTVSYSNSSYGISNTRGLELNNKSNLIVAYSGPVIEVDDTKYDGLGYIVANSVNEIDPKKIAKDGVEDALSRVGGKSIASGKYKVVINNEAMVSLLKNYIGIFSANRVQKGLSLLKGKEGKMIASDIVTIIDDPHMEKGLSTTPFDDEGVATYKKDIVRSGKLITLLHNLKTANKDGVKSTGNGFKSSYASTVGIDATNFYIKSGDKSLEELINQVGNGLMITEFSGLNAGINSTTGDFSLAAKGFYIERGKKSHPVEQITVAGNYFDLLRSIEEIGNDLKFPMSSFGAPSVIVTELSVAGK